MPRRHLTRLAEWPYARILPAGGEGGEWIDHFAAAMTFDLSGKTPAGLHYGGDVGVSDLARAGAAAFRLSPRAGRGRNLR
jgi:hypothetical protein